MGQKTNNYYGYKSHINADCAHKMIQAYKVTKASLHDSQVFEELRDHTIDLKTGKKREMLLLTALIDRKKKRRLC